jgi:hypothetical protein
MLPGREMDALVAERVMGWKLWSYDEDRYASTTDDYMDASVNDGWIWKDETGDSDGEAWEWQPSIDIRAAWEVVEKLDAPDFQVKRVDYGPGQTWMAGVDGRWFDYGDSAPHAICLAALKAVGAHG